METTSTQLKIKLGKKTLLMTLEIPFGSGWNLSNDETKEILLSGWQSKSSFGVDYKHQSTDLFYNELREMVKKGIKKLTN